MSWMSEAMKPGKQNPDFFKKYIVDSFLPAGVREAEQEFVTRQYNQTRADNRADWVMQNEYNHPLEQMNRLRQAGLNPNLVYGKGADATAGSIQSATPGRVNFQPSQLPQQVAGLVQSIRLNKAQTDNVAANTQVAMANKNAIEAGVAKTLQETARSKFDLEQAQQLKDGVIERQKLDNKLLGQSYLMNIQNYDLQKLGMEINQARLHLEKAKNQQDIKESEQRIKQAVATTVGIGLNNAYSRLRNTELFPLEKNKLEQEVEQMKQTLINLKATGGILKADQTLKEMGLQPSDPLYLRLLVQKFGTDKPWWIEDKIPTLMNAEFKREYVPKGKEWDEIYNSVMRNKK